MAPLSAPAPWRSFYDNFVNFVSGLGTWKDPTTHARRATTIPLTQAQLEASYRQDWIARKAVDIPARDATREWRNWQAENDQIELIEAAEETLGIQNKTFSAMLKARLYGGAVLVMGVEVGEPQEELDIEKVKKDSLKFVHAVSRHEVTTGPLIDDLDSEWFGEPEYYERQPLIGGTSKNTGVGVRIHPSRVVRFIGNELPSLRLATDGGWGDSILQAIDSAVKQSGLAQQGIAAMINDAKMDIIKIPGMTQHLLNKDYSQRLLERFSLANQAKSVINTLLLDKEEEWERIETSFAGLPDILKLYLLIASGAADIPATRMLGQSATGLNSTGDADIRNYYDRIASEQRTQITPAMVRLDEVLVRSATGSDDENIFYEWAPLWQQTEAEKAELAAKKAATFKVDVDTGVFPTEVLAEVRANQLIEDGTYPGLEASLEKWDFEAHLEEEHERVEPDPLELMQAEAEIKAAASPGQLPPAKRQALPPPTKSIPSKDVGLSDGKWRSRLRKRRIKRHDFDDSIPRTLYVRRQILNHSDIRSWAKAQGFPTVVIASEMHVTVMYSRTPVDWLKIGQDWTMGSVDARTAGKSDLIIPEGGPRIVEQFGEGAIVLGFASTSLSWRHEDMKRVGCSWDYQDFQPHITFTYNRGNIDLTKVEPYRGIIVLGPEIFEECKEAGYVPGSHIEDGFAEEFIQEKNDGGGTPRDLTLDPASPVFRFRLRSEGGPWIYDDLSFEAMYYGMRIDLPVLVHDGMAVVDVEGYDSDGLKEYEFSMTRDKERLRILHGVIR